MIRGRDEDSAVRGQFHKVAVGDNTVGHSCTSGQGRMGAQDDWKG